MIKRGKVIWAPKPLIEFVDQVSHDNKIKQCYVINFTDKRNSWIWEPIFLEEDDLERLWSEFQMVQSMFNLLVPDEAKVPLI